MTSVVIENCNFINVGSTSGVIDTIQRSIDHIKEDFINILPITTVPDNKFLKINGKVVTLPKKALGNGSKNPVFPNGKNPDVKPFEQRAASEKLAEDFLKAKEQGLINAKDSKFPRHLRKIAE